MKQFILFITSLIITGFVTAQDSVAPDYAKPFKLGEIRHYDSKILKEDRILNVYLPEGYKKEDAERYPVIYLLDGSAEEDFIHVVGLVQYFNFPWINQVPKSIVVGIANVDRKRDFSFPTKVPADLKKWPTMGHSEDFIGFLEKEVQPYIERTYKTNSSRMIIGQSLGGLLATEILFKKPQMFDKYLIISPSLWWDGGSLLDFHATLLDENYIKKTDVYICVGKEGQTPTDPPRIMEDDAKSLAEKLKTAKNKNIRVLFEYMPDENHATIGHVSVMKGFQALFPVEGKKE